MTTETIELSADTVKKSVSWYWLNKERIAAALPLTTAGTIYRAGYLPSLEREIAQREAGVMELNLTRAYILFLLQRVKGALKQ